MKNGAVPPRPEHGRRPPSRWVKRFVGLIPRTPLAVLDLACGEGRHVRLLRAAGHRVVALDRDGARLRAFAADDGVETVVADLESGSAWPLAGRRFAGIVVTNYLHRPLFAAIEGALAEGGVLIYETFAAGNERYGRPARPAFLLRPGELLEVFAARLEVVAYEHGRLAGPSPRVVQRICATRPGDGGAPPARIG